MGGTARTSAAETYSLEHTASQARSGTLEVGDAVVEVLQRSVAAAAAAGVVVEPLLEVQPAPGMKWGHGLMAELQRARVEGEGNSDGLETPGRLVELMA